MYSGLSMVNDETYSNISLGSLYQTCEITRKYLKSIADRIEHGANIDDQENMSGNVPLHYTVSFRHMRISELLIENGASIDFKALNGATALTYTVRYKQKEMADFLIENGANVNSTCNNLKTPLHLALALDHKKICIFASSKWCIFKCQGPRQDNSNLMRKQMTDFKTTIVYNEF